MEALFTEEHRHLREVVRRAVDKHIAPLARSLDEEDRPNESVLALLHDLGVLSLCVPERLGGSARDAVACSIVTEEISKASPAIGVMCVANWATMNVLAARPSPVTDAMLGRWLARPTLGSYCLSEPRGGSDAGNLETRATRSGGGYIINGTKCWITNGGVSQVAVVVAATRPGVGARGTTAFVLDTGTAGFEVTRLERKMGTRGTTLAEIRLTNVVVDESQRVGAEGEGLSLAMESQNISRVALGACCVGLAQAALDHAVAYGNERTQFGQPIGKFQGMQFKYAEMATKIEAARSLVYRCARVINDTGAASRESRRLAAMTKLFTSDMAMEVTIEAVQAFGGCGYIQGAPVEMLMRDAKVFQIFAGTNEIQKNTIAKLLQS